MKNSKSFKKEMEKKQKSLFLVGLLVSLSLTLMAFEWATFDVDYVGGEKEIVEEEIILEIPKEVEIEKPKKTLVANVVEFDPDLADTFEIKKYDTAIAMDRKPLIDTSDDIKEIDDDTTASTGGGVVIEEVFMVVEKMPEFPGGEDALYKYLGKKIRHTQCSKQSNISGKLYVQFIVEKDGSISNITVPRGLGCGLDEMAAKAVRKMPKWSPGEQRGKPVRVKYTLPVSFVLK